jgi:conjugative transposon TraJ protein
MNILFVDFDNLHGILRNLYDEMLPLCSDMTGVATGIAGFGALLYIAYRVWHSIAEAEPVDVFPLLRPFAIGICIMFFPTLVLGTINAVMSPVVTGCGTMLESQVMDMNKYREQKDKLEHEAMLRDPSTALFANDELFDAVIDALSWTPGDMVTMTGMYLERGMYTMKKYLRDAFRELLELLFQAAGLVVDTVRTFFLVVLSILGPVAFALSVYDGFQSSLVQWLGRYLTTYLWLPVSDLFSSIMARLQVLMIQNDISELTNNPNHSIDASNTLYITFLIIGIIGYFTIPTVAGWIVSAGGFGPYMRHINTTASRGAGVAGAATGAAAGNITGRLMRR